MITVGPSMEDQKFITFPNHKPNPLLISSPVLHFFNTNSNFWALIPAMTRNLDVDSSPTFVDQLHPVHPVLKLLDFTCRLLSVPLSLATIWLTVTNREDNSTYGRLEFSNLTGLKYMVSVSAISAAYALGMAVCSWVRCFVIKAWVFFVSDQVVAYLMITSAAAAAEILYLAHHGDREVSWSEACSSYAKFCHRMKLALILHGLAFLCFFLLSLISAYTTFSTFHPPLPSKEAEEERS